MDISEAILTRYLQNECSEEDLRILNAWLSEKAENRQELFTMEALFKTNNWKRYSDPVFLQKEKAKLYKRIDKETATKEHRLLIKRVMQYAAIAAIAVLISVGAYHFHTNSSMQTMAAGQDNVKQIVLPDGTKVWLNHSSELKYPEKFTGKNRTVHLEGEGYFEVTKNAEHPFIVETKRMEIMVLGTTFNVISPQTTDISSVTLLEGEVKVKGNHQEGTIFLTPGQRAELNPSTHKLQVMNLEQVSLDVVWHNGLIPFHQASIEEIGNVLEQLYHIKVHFNSPAPGKTYSGVLKKQDSIGEMLHLLNHSIPIEYEIKGDEVYITRQ
jgi:ferric-dicitrate binding protein FerR (iron transport regulator)